MSREPAGDAPADIIGTADRDVRRDPVNRIFVSSEAWETTTLGEIADIRNGATPSTRISANWDGSIPWCTPTDITNAPGKYLTETARSITEKGLTGCGASLLPAGALLLCSRATIGEIKIASSPICTNQGFKSLVCTKQVHNEFLYYLILTLKPRLVQQAVGSTFLEIGKHALSSMEVRLPSLEEQRAIAEVLSDVDGLIESLESLIIKKQAVKMAAMQQLLTGKTRLPGFSVKWEKRKIAEIANPRREKNNLSENLPVLTCSKHLGFVDSLSYFKNQVFSKDISGYKIIRRGDIGYPANHIEEGSIGLQNLYDIALVSPIYVVCSPAEGVDNYFLHRLLKLDYYRHKFATATMFSIDRRGSLKWSAFSQIDVSLPAFDEQCAIAAVLSDMDAEIAALEQRRDKTRALKQGVMQQLLTGKIRLAESVQTTTWQASATSTGKGHNWQINEAVVISVLVGRFGNKEYPLSRMRYTKLSYLLHRHVEGHAEGYLKKAAGPYNPRTRYGGPEKIALKNHYVHRHGNGSYRGFIAGENIEKAESYFAKWYGEDSLKWLDRFRYERSGDLELLTTVDLAAEELRKAGKDISVESVKEAIRSDPEWKAKLNRSIFSDDNIARAIDKCRTLFDPDHEWPKP